MSEEIPLHYVGWLAVNCAYPDQRYRAKLSARLTKKKPALKRDEIAVKVELSLPRSLFVKPALKANIAVDESSVTPPEISLELRDEIEQVLRDRTGVDIKIQPATDDE